MKLIRSFFLRLQFAALTVCNRSSFVVIASKKKVVRYIGKLNVAQVKLIIQDLEELLADTYEGEAAVQTAKEIINKK